MKKIKRWTIASIALAGAVVVVGYLCASAGIGAGASSTGQTASGTSTQDADTDREISHNPGPPGTPTADIPSRQDHSNLPAVATPSRLKTPTPTDEDE